MLNRVSASRGGNAVVLLAVIAVSALALLWVSGARSPARADQLPDGLIDCGREVPLVKCNESLYSPRPDLAPGPGHKIPVNEVEETTPCSATFFSSDDVAALTKQFGTLGCFTIIGSDRWIVTGDGMSTTAEVEEASPGGAIVAELTCGSDDKTCLDPSSAHDFSTFSVSYPPTPMSGRSTLQEIEDSRFLMVANGGCGIFAFDITTRKWFSGAVAGILDDVLAGKDAQQAAVPASISGGDALGTTPSDVSTSCQSLEVQ